MFDVVCKMTLGHANRDKTRQVLGAIDDRCCSWQQWVSRVLETVVGSASVLASDDRETVVLGFSALRITEEGRDLPRIRVLVSIRRRAHPKLEVLARMWATVILHVPDST